MSTLLSKILNYELEIFNKYLESRKKLLTFIKEIKINNLSNQQVLIFINDLKQVIDPVITSQQNIDYLLLNNMKSDDSIKNQNEIKKITDLYFLLEYLRLTCSEEEEEELSLESVSLESLESVSLESLDSESVSV
jgi:hypothetical protein